MQILRQNYEERFKVFISPDFKQGNMLEWIHQYVAIFELKFELLAPGPSLGK